MPASAPNSLYSNKPSIKQECCQPSRRLQTQKKKVNTKGKVREGGRKENGRNTIYSRLTPRIATRASRDKKRKHLEEREKRERGDKIEMSEHCGAKKRSRKQGISGYGDPDEGRGRRDTWTQPDSSRTWVLCFNRHQVLELTPSSWPGGVK
jgi:hypothetical protein